MAYAATAIIHEPGHVPGSPSTEYDRATRPVDRGATLERTVIYYDDADAIPAGPASQEHDRYDIPIGVDERNRQAIFRAAQQAMAQLATIRDAPTLTTQQAIDAIQFQAGILRRLIRLTVPGLLDDAN